MTKRLVIIDGKSVFYRGYYAMPNLTTKDGTPTGGVYGFATMALEIVKKLKPDYVCVAWDKSGTNIRARLKLYPQYKAGRKPTPPDFKAQVPILHELLDALEWPFYELDDYEADDIMGAFAKQAGAVGVESYLVTSDLDVLQLINSHTHIYTLKKGLTNIELFHEEYFKEKYGVGAHQWVDVKALKGDASDNIPGVAGVGEKTALDLIKKYETLDGVYAHLDYLKPALKTKLQEHKDMAYLSKQLVTLLVDAPITLDMDKAKLKDGVTPEFVAFLRKYEFRTLLRQAEAQLFREQAEHPEETPAQPALPAAHMVDFDPAMLSAGQPRIIAMNPDATELWVSSDGTHVAALPLVVEGRSADEVAKSLPIELLANGPMVGHSLKPLLRVLLANAVGWPGTIGHDTRIGAFLLNSLQRALDLSDLLEQPVDMENAGQTIAAIWQVYQDQLAQFKELPELYKLAREVEFPNIQLLAIIEHRGIHLDSAYLQAMSEQLAERITEFEQKIYELAGQEFNISSPSQLGTILFEKMGLPTKGIKRGKTGYSTGVNELDKLRGLSPIINLITVYREYTKLKNTYVDTLPKQVDAEGKLHTTFTLDVAATGRLSSINPNLQNIPTRSEVGQAIREAFVPAEGNVFVSADYSQFELRLAAAIADDKELVETFNKGEDVHAVTAAEVYGVPLEAVTKDQRRNAKVVNFGILYGMSAHGLQIATGMNRDEAQAFIDAYFALRPQIRRYMDQTIEQALKDGYVQTIFGRRRPTPDLKSSNFIVREAAKRAAINMPIQGTEADLMKMAMLRVEEALDGLGEQILQIHDSILVETPKANAEKVATLLKETMENIHKLPVKLAVEVTTGTNWGEL
ncbi:MAG TPA: DNA polymerase I [Candidatus Saccharimonadales bacterium]|nr:DNA polymerase I [Candidatus Saccharimonadales bacterium]